MKYLSKESQKTVKKDVIITVFLVILLSCRGFDENLDIIYFFKFLFLTMDF